MTKSKHGMTIDQAIQIKIMGQNNENIVDNETINEDSETNE
jgi:hypothetical protein